MFREIEMHLEKWKNKSKHKPVILRGARQVGKTYTIKKFGKKSFKNFACVDFERNPDWKKVFEQNPAFAPSMDNRTSATPVPVEDM